MKRVLLAAVLMCCAVTTNAQDWGTVTGQYVFSGDIPKPELLFAKGAASKDPEVCSAEDTFKDDLVINADSRGIANIFVYLAKAPAKVHPDLKAAAESTITFDQKNCVFIPHAMVTRIGQKVEVLNSDGVPHNTHSFPLKNAAKNVVVSPNTGSGKGEIFENKLGETLPYNVKCDFHPWMSAYWLAVDHPYAVVTDRDGKFTIPNLPVGDHELRVWHERVGYIERKLAVKVAAGDNALKPVELTIEKLTPKPK
jgi:plastocyanin